MNIKSAIFLIVYLFISSYVNSQSDTILSVKNAVPEILVGKFERTDLQKGEFSKYFFDEYKKYCPKKEFTDQLKNKIFAYPITIAMGTWCQDSREQVPRFFKILDELNYNTNYLEIICVDKNKSAGIDISDLKILRVPTFIFYQDGVEKGRIIETPSLTLEEDTYKIIND
jgi:hypothetical protein